MTKDKMKLRKPILIVVSLLALLGYATPSQATTVTGGSATGRSKIYDYSPSFIESGNIIKEWWCGGRNSSDPSTYHDTIQFQEYNTSGVPIVQDRTVFSNGTIGWDSRFTCNATVVEGTFVNPLGNGSTYTYAMYYVGTSVVGGTDNQIGAAFSNDGMSWLRFPTPVIAFANPGHGAYGDAQPAAYWDGTNLILSYELGDTTGNSYWQAISTDGAHFNSSYPLTTSGLHSPSVLAGVPSWGSFAYDRQDGNWYGTFDNGYRNPSTTGGTTVTGDWGITLFSTNDPVNGTWKELSTYDTGQSGFQTTGLGGILHNPDGSVYSAGLSSITVEVNVPNPKIPWNAFGSAYAANGNVSNWDLVSWTWYPGDALRHVFRARNGNVYITTTGWFDALAYPTVDNVNLGGLFEAPTGQATTAVYDCKGFSSDYFFVTDPYCNGAFFVGLAGYGYSTPAADRLPLYRCEVSQVGDFMSADPGCEGNNYNYGLVAYSQN